MSPVDDQVNKLKPYTQNTCDTTFDELTHLVKKYPSLENVVYVDLWHCSRFKNSSPYDLCKCIEKIKFTTIKKMYVGSLYV